MKKKNKKTSKKKAAKPRTPLIEFAFPMAGAIAVAFLAPGLAQDAMVEEAPLDAVQTQPGARQPLQPARVQLPASPDDELTAIVVDGVVTYVPTSMISEEQALAPGAEQPAATLLVEEPAPVNPDEMADMLNSQQQLKQTYTLKRTINGKVVESEKRTVTFDRNAPYRETEAGATTVEALKAAFDGELLTRIEAFEEAKLDFTIADANRDQTMTQDEFLSLVDTWRQSDDRAADAPTEEIARQRQYDAFLSEINPQAAESQSDQYAREKFAFMAGAAQTVSREVYIREYLLDFDTMDTNKDTLLRDDELMRFRALNRGEKIN